MKKEAKSEFGTNIQYYCKDCEKFVDASKIGRKYVFRCPICKTKNVAFGTKKSLVNFFHIDEKKMDKVEKKPEIKSEEKDTGK